MYGKNGQPPILPCNRLSNVGAELHNFLTEELAVQIDEAVNAFILRYFSVRRRQGKTERAYNTDLKQFIKHINPGSCLEQVRVETLEKWARELADQGYAPRSIRRKFAALRVFFSYWVQVGDLPSSPLWKVRLDLGREHRLPRALKASDMLKLVEHAWNTISPGVHGPKPSSDRHFLAIRNLAMMEILFATGMRVGELVALNLSDWDSGESSFLVNGKGSRQRIAVLPDDRSIAAFQQYIDRRTEIPLGHDALFVNSAGTRLSTQGVARMLAKMARRATISVRVTPHMLRHTVATLLVRNGADIRVVQEVLGHSTIATTQQYVHVAKEQLRRELRKHHPNCYLASAPIGSCRAIKTAGDEPITSQMSCSYRVVNCIERGHRDLKACPRRMPIEKRETDIPE